MSANTTEIQESLSSAIEPRANSELKSSGNSVPVLKLIFQLHPKWKSVGLIVGLLVLANGIAVGGPIRPWRDPAFEVRVTEGIVYGHGEVESPSPGMKPLLLDLCEPDGPTALDRRRPAILMIHGGGFVRGSRQFAAWVRMATELAMRGYVVASIDYRLGDDAPVLSDRVQAIPVHSPFELWMTAAVDDGLTALDWLVANSDTLYLDPSRLGVMGGSAGAATAKHLAYTMNGYGIDAPAFGFVVDFWGAAAIPRDDPVAAANHLETGEPPSLYCSSYEVISQAGMALKGKVEMWHGSGQLPIQRCRSKRA